MARLLSKITWTEKDLGYRELTKRLGRTACGMSVSVGVQGAEAAEPDENGTPLGDVAGYNEFGTRLSPPRPFLGTAFEVHGGWRVDVEKVATKVMDGLEAQPIMEALGAKIVKDVQDVVDSGRGRFQPNAPSTIAKKGDDLPLVASGRLRAAITAKLWRGKKPV